MAHIVTLRILVDEPDETRVYDGINEMLGAAQAPVDPETDDSRGSSIGRSVLA